MPYPLPSLGTTTTDRVLKVVFIKKFG
jgi:hypothetical protein